MANERYSRSLDRLIERFISDFLDYSRRQFTNDDGRLSHPGEFGNSREVICKSLFQNIIPNRINIDLRGFVITANNQTSKEQDLIFYSGEDTPLLTLDSTKFFPVETVVGIAQVKSVLRTREELRLALDELSAVKQLRQKMGHTSVIHRKNQHTNGANGYDVVNPYDQISTFLICEKLDFKITPQEIDDLFPAGTHIAFKHNLILDLSKGVYGYFYDPDGKFVGIPHFSRGTGRPHLNGAINNFHIKHFLVTLQILIPAATVYHPDMGVYLSNR